MSQRSWTPAALECKIELFATAARFYLLDVQGDQVLTTVLEIVLACDRTAELVDAIRTMKARRAP